MAADPSLTVWSFVIPLIYSLIVGVIASVGAQFATQEHTQRFGLWLAAVNGAGALVACNAFIQASIAFKGDCVSRVMTADVMGQAFWFARTFLILAAEALVAIWLPPLAALLARAAYAIAGKLGPEAIAFVVRSLDKLGSDPFPKMKLFQWALLGMATSISAVAIVSPLLSHMGNPEVLRSVWEGYETRCHVTGSQSSDWPG
jgi:hypothetical protein